MKNYSKTLLFASLLVAFNVWHNTTRSFWNGSALDSLTMSPRVIELAKRYHPDIRIHKPYDGAFYYAMTFDPLLVTTSALDYIDAPGYRYKRVLLPLLARIFSFENFKLFPYTLLLINATAWILSALAGYKILSKEARFRRFLGWFGVLTTTGLTFAAFRTLSEPLSICLSLWGCYLCLNKGRWLGGGLLFSLAGLAREFSLIAPFTLAVHQIMRDKSQLKRMASFMSVAVSPFVIWSIYVHTRVPLSIYPLSEHVSFPFIGMIRDVITASEKLTTNTEQIRLYSIMIIAPVLIVSPFLFFRKRKSVWGRLALMEGLFCSVVYGDVWTYYAGASRIIAPLMIYWLLWMVDGNAANENELSLTANKTGQVA